MINEMTVFVVQYDIYHTYYYVFGMETLHIIYAALRIYAIHLHQTTKRHKMWWENELSAGTEKRGRLVPLILNAVTEETKEKTYKTSKKEVETSEKLLKKGA